MDCHRMNLICLKAAACVQLTLYMKIAISCTRMQTAGSLFFSRNFNRQYEGRLFSLKENGTRHGPGTHHWQKKNRLMILRIRHCMTCIARLCYASRKLTTLYLLYCQLSVIEHILTNQVLHCQADGGFQKLKKNLQTVFSRLAFFPTRKSCHAALLRSR